MNWNRRRFIKTAALASGAVGVTAAENEGCGVAIGTYGLQSLPLADAIRVIGGTGFDAVEIAVIPGTTGDPATTFDSVEKRKVIRSVVEDSGLRICGLMTDLKPEKDDKKHLAQLYALRDLVELAQDLAPGHPPIIQTILGGKDWESSRGLFRDRLANWNQILADQKGYLSIKPHRSHAMSTPLDANWILEQLGFPPRLRMVYDYSHYAFHEPELSIAESVADALPITNYVAVKDAVEIDGKVRFALAGESDSWDQAEVVRSLYLGGYRGDFCCEVSSQIWRDNPSYDPKEATRICYRNLVDAFDRAGVARG